MDFFFFFFPSFSTAFFPLLPSVLVPVSSSFAQLPLVFGIRDFFLNFCLIITSSTQRSSERSRLDCEVVSRENRGPECCKWRGGGHVGDLLPLSWSRRRREREKEKILPHSPFCLRRREFLVCSLASGSKKRKKKRTQRPLSH